MGSKRVINWVLLGIFLGLLLGTAMLGAFNHDSGEIFSKQPNCSLESLGSTNPSSPTLLSDDSAYSDYYYYSSYYYYRTSSTASSSYYHAIWIKPSSNDFDLALYSDSGYSSLIAGSYAGGTTLDCVLVRPSSSQYYYAKGWSCSGDGSVYIEYEDSSDSLTVGSSYACALSSTECMEVYMVYLYYGSSYSFTLDVPSGADYDLYLYYLSSGSATSYLSFTRGSATSGSGYDESILNYAPSYTSYYAIIVAWKSGSGTAYLYPAYSSVSTTVLNDDSPSYQSYSAGTYNYYQTGTASSSYYQVVWVQPSSSYNFDLYLYSDSAYSTLRASSTRGSGFLDWVVFYPSSSQYYYPMVYSYDTGSGYIEWEDSSSGVSTGNSYSCYPSSSNCIETYRIYLYSGSSYSFTLDVPSGADYDLYLYYLSSGSATTGYSGYTRCSVTSGSGYDESISSYTPSYTGYYAIIISWKSGSGYAYLYPTSSSGSYTSLSDETALYQSYSSSTNYYYQTGYAYSGYYHVIWVHPTSSSYSDNLYLYSDSSFNYQLASSARGSGDLNWVVVRPSSSQYYYPRVYSYSGGYAYLEWESSSSSLYVGGSTYDSLGSSECVEIYEVYLSSSKTYTFTLDTPSSGDYDLYLYGVYYGGATGSSGYSGCSVAYGSGQDESISNFKPSTSDDYLIMVVRSSGSGSFTLTLKESVTMSPGAIVLVIFGILATIGISAGVYKKYSGQRRPAQPQRTVQGPTQAVKPIPQKLEPPKIIQKLPQSITCAYCQSKNDLNGLFCNNCGCEL